MYKKYLICLTALLSACTLFATEYHVSPSGSDSNDGSKSNPFKTISAAARIAQPGDVVTVHEGIYRERIDPPRGGTSDDRRIVYQAAAGEIVTIKGSEVITGWSKTKNDTWMKTLPNSFFGSHNPYKIKVHGDWYRPLGEKGRIYHTGSLYLNGHWLKEAASKEKVLEPQGKEPLWFAQVDGAQTVIWGQFKGIDPNRETVEINVRETVFYPEAPGRNYITVRGFTMEHASPNWAPPTAEQVGLLGTHWSKGWIIEDNTIRYATCTGITLGKYGDDWDNRAQSAVGYVGTINRALEKGWSPENIGHHIVRNNHISHCEQAGIVGSLGAAFSTVTGNTIHDINMRKMFSGAEMAGIKFHAPIDSLISNNHVYRCGGFGGLWLDWMTQGTRVTGNLFHDNTRDIFVEVNHGPYLVDNNICLSGQTLRDWSQGGAYVHNLFAGNIIMRTEKRETPHFKPHSVDGMKLSNIMVKDHRFYNNLFLRPLDLKKIVKSEYLATGGNVFLRNPGFKLETKGDRTLITVSGLKGNSKEKRAIVTTELLGRAKIPDLPFVQPDGKPYRLDRNYLGGKRNDSPAAGPFSLQGDKISDLKVWPK